MTAAVRPGWRDWGLGLAQAVSGRGDCTRRRVGAVILDTNHRVVSVGYNGTNPGGPSCLQGDCPRGQHYRRYDWADPHGIGRGCACGAWWPCPQAVEPGSSYDTGPGACIASHAEINAVMDVDNRDRLDGATLYITHQPCDGCLKIIRNTTRIASVIWPEGEQ